MLLKRFILAFLLIFTISPTALALAEAKEQTVLIKVKGLYCPFCSYGLEKHVKKLDGFKSVQINIKEGTAEIKFKPGATISEKAILTAVEDAGFDLDELKWLAKNNKQ